MHDPQAALGTAEDILRRAGAVPQLTSIPTVDELNAGLERLRAEHPNLISCERIGTSRLGEPIWLYHVGAGRRSALIVGGVHPNEPIGSLTILHLVEQLAVDAAFRTGADTAWHVVPCADPDGMRLNEGWFADPSDRGLYTREFFRPAPDEQVEWTFPFAYKDAYFDAMMPETVALARAIDLTTPDLYVPLHNSEGGGAYFYVSRPIPALYPLLHEITASCGVPLHTGEPEGAHFTVLADAIYEMGTLQDAYDWTEEAGLDPYPPGSAGEASTSYANRYGALSLIAELPQFGDPAADDSTLTDTIHRDALRRCGERLVETGRMLTGLIAQVDPHVRMDTPLLRAARVFTHDDRRRGGRSPPGREGGRPARHRGRTRQSQRGRQPASPALGRDAATRADRRGRSGRRQPGGATRGDRDRGRLRRLARRGASRRRRSPAPPGAGRRSAVRGDPRRPRPVGAPLMRVTSRCV